MRSPVFKMLTSTQCTLSVLGGISKSYIEQGSHAEAMAMLLRAKRQECLASTLLARTWSLGNAPSHSEYNDQK